MSLRMTCAGLCAALVMICTSSNADAAFRLTISSGGDTEEIIGGTATSTGQIINFTGQVGQYFVQINSSFTNQPTGGAGGATAQLTQTIDVSRTIAGDDDIMFFLTSTDFEFPAPLMRLVSQVSANSLDTGNAGRGALGKADFESFADPGNAEFAETVSPGTQVFPLDSADRLPTLYIDSVETTFSDNPVEYSLSNRVTLNLVEVADTFGGKFTTEVSAVPEPGTMALLALGGLGLAGARVRRRRKASA